MPAKLFEVEVTVREMRDSFVIVVYANRSYVVQATALRYESNRVYIDLERLSIHNLFRG